MAIPVDCFGFIDLPLVPRIDLGQPLALTVLAVGAFQVDQSDESLLKVILDHWQNMVEVDHP